MDKTLQNKMHGCGRGKLLTFIKPNKCHSESSKPLQMPLEEVKRYNILSNKTPVRSTYIPPELDENDESIYETGINTGINFGKLNEIEIKVTGQNTPEKLLKFDGNISKELMENIKKCKFKKPTPIQQYTIPIIVSGLDLMAAAQTGSGKTVIKYVFILEKLATMAFSYNELTLVHFLKII